MASIQARMAGAAAHAANEAWTRHAANCGECGRHPRTARCEIGGTLFREARLGAAAAAHQRELDKQPDPGQGGLW